MANVNLVVQVGRLVRDPELTRFENGGSITKFVVATNRTYKKKSGEKVEEVTFVDCEAGGKTGETIEQYLHKGDLIAITQGRLKSDSWVDKQTGQKRSKLLVVVDRFEFMGSPKGGKRQDGPTFDGSSEAASRGYSSGGGNVDW